MTAQITPRARRLLILAILSGALGLWLHFFGYLLNPQTVHLRAVRAHIEKIAAQWETFRAGNPGFDQVRLFAYTGGDGLFGASGFVPSEQHVERLRLFMESTTPPRPVYTCTVRVDPEFLDYQKTPKTTLR